MYLILFENFDFSVIRVKNDLFILVYLLFLKSFRIFVKKSFIIRYLSCIIIEQSSVLINSLSFCLKVSISNKHKYNEFQ